MIHYLMKRVGNLEPFHAGDATTSTTPEHTMDNDDDGDDVVLRLPVFLRPADPQTPLCLFQYPLRPRWRPYNLDELRGAKVRPEQRRVELTLGMECSPAHHDEDSRSPLTSIALDSTSTSAKTSYAIGQLNVNEHGAPQSVSLMPLSSAIQLRPSLAQLLPEGETNKGASSSEPAADDADDAAMDEFEGEDEELEEAAGSALVAPVFRAAQTEREIEARKSSHAYLLEQRDAEPWRKAILHPPEAPETKETRARCFDVAP